jgi:hypothetical protein
MIVYFVLQQKVEGSQQITIVTFCCTSTYQLITHANVYILSM